MRKATPPPLVESTGKSISTWRLVGAAVWHAAIVAAITSSAALLLLGPVTHPLRALGTLFSLATLAVGTLLQILQLAVLGTHRLLLAASEPAPLHFPKLGLHGRSWPTLLASRLVVRGRNGNTGRVAALAPAAALGAALLSAVATLYGSNVLRAAGSPSPLPLGWCLRLGLILSVLHVSGHLLRGGEVLRYPAVHRHRFHRLKAEFPAAALASLQLASTSLALTLGWSLLRGGALPRGAAAGFVSAVAAALCAVSWRAAALVLQCVFTERVRLAERGALDLSGPLMAALDSPTALLQDLALQDLAAFSEERGGTGGPHERRAAVFSDPTGRVAWTPIAGFMTAELKELVEGLAQALPTMAGDAMQAAAAPAGSSGAMQWNVLRLSPSLGGVAATASSREQDLAGWTVRAKYFRASFCMRSLSGLAAASMLRVGGDDGGGGGGAPEDRYGVVLMTTPTLGDIVGTLISCVLVLQQYGRLAASLAQRSSGTSALGRALAGAAEAARGCLPLALDHRAWQQPLASEQQVAAALEDTCRGCLYRLVTTFGTRVQDAVRHAAGPKALWGSAVEHEALLAALLRYEA